MISPELGRHDPDHVAGVHVTQVFSFPSGDPAEMADLTRTSRRSSERSSGSTRTSSASTRSCPSSRRPSGYAVNDSPVGLLAWNAQLLGEDLDPDFALTNVMTYWLTRTGGVGRAPLLRERARGPARPSRPRVPLGSGRVRRRLLRHPPVRRAGPREHRSLGDLRPRRPLRGAQGPRPVRGRRPGVLPLDRPLATGREMRVRAVSRCISGWWEEEDSNLRRLRRRFYRPLPLATRASSRDVTW